MKDECERAKRQLGPANFVPAKKAEQNSLDDLIASGGLPEATPLGEKSREQLIADKDAMRAEIAKLKVERDAAVGKPYTNIIQEEMLRDEFIHGLECAKKIIHEHPLAMRQVLQAEIDKAKAK